MPPLLFEIKQYLGENTNERDVNLMIDYLNSKYDLVYGRRAKDNVKGDVSELVALMITKGHISQLNNDYRELIECLNEAHLKGNAARVQKFIDDDEAEQRSKEKKQKVKKRPHSSPSPEDGSEQVEESTAVRRTCKEGGASELPHHLEYNTTGNGLKGLVCIINNFVEEREGSEKDAEDVRQLFLSEPFRKYYELEPTKSDLKKKKLESYLAYLVKKVNNPKSKYGSLLLFFMTHGNQKQLKVASEKDSKVDTVPWELVTECFNRSLPGKPKVLVLQACRGEDIACDDINQSEASVESDDVQEEDIRALINSDTLVAYATIPGYVAFRNKRNGSWFIQELVKQLEKQAALTTRSHLTDILTNVNRNVSQTIVKLERESSSSDDSKSNKKLKLGGQMPQYVSTLRKSFYVLPRENPASDLPN